MSDGVRVMVFSKDPGADRAFARDLLGLSCADAGGGWLVFELAPGQSGVDDFGIDDGHQLYLHCRDLDQLIAALGARGVEAGAARQEQWGRHVSVALPGGAMVRMHETRGSE